MKSTLLACVLLSSLVISAAPAQGRDKSAYWGGTVGYIDMLTDSGPAGVYDRGFSFGLRGGIFVTSNYAYLADLGIDAGLTGPDFDGWYIQVPSAQVGFGVGGDITMLFLQVGTAPFGLDGFSDRLIVSIFNPRIGLAFQYHPQQWLFRVEVQLEHMFRLADETDVTSLHLRLTIGRSTSLLR